MKLLKKFFEYSEDGILFDTLIYSINKISQPILNDITGEIDLMGDFTLFGEPTGMFEVAYPKQDIRCRVKS